MANISDKELFELVATCMKHSEKRIAEVAARIATAQVCEHLQHIGILDENGYAKPGQRLKIRIVDPRCYPPLVMS